LLLLRENSLQIIAMIEDPYPFVIHNRNKLYIFASIGKQRIQKVIQFSYIEDDVYNLGLADFKNGCLDFYNFSANGDSWKVLITVASAVVQFTEHYPNAEVIIRASESKRLQLYNRILEHRLVQINTLFEVFGITDYSNKIAEPFQVGKKYEAFSVKRKLKL
jgi:hypothetical protein